MPETIYGVGGDYADDDPLCLIKPADQVAAEFLLTLDNLDPQPLDQLQEVVAPMASSALVEICKDRSKSYRLAEEVIVPFRDPPPLTEEQLRRLELVDLNPLKPRMEHADEEEEFQNIRRYLLAELIDQFQEWVRTFHLTSQTLCQIVLETLADWEYQKTKGVSVKAGRWGLWVDFLADPDRESKEWDIELFRGGKWPYLDTRDFELRVPAWDPYEETWSQAKSRIREKFERALNDHQKQIEELVEQQGSKSPRKRNPREHFEWLVRYQVSKESFTSIADSLDKDRKTVTEAIERTAELMDLLLREPSSAGRPSGIPSTVRHRAER